MRRCVRAVPAAWLVKPTRCVVAQAKLARFGITRQLMRLRSNRDSLRAKYNADPVLLPIANAAQCRHNHRVAVNRELAYWDAAENESPDDDAAAAHLAASVDVVRRIPGTVMLPKETRTFKDLAANKLVTLEVAREMHRIWFEAQTKYVVTLTRYVCSCGGGGWWLVAAVAVAMVVTQSRRHGE
jgi:hypothetical protein